MPEQTHGENAPSAKHRKMTLNTGVYANDGPSDTHIAAVDKGNQSTMLFGNMCRKAHRTSRMPPQAICTRKLTSGAARWLKRSSILGAKTYVLG